MGQSFPLDEAIFLCQLSGSGVYLKAFRIEIGRTIVLDFNMFFIGK